MRRWIGALLICIMLAPCGPVRGVPEETMAVPVFFSMIFPQLVPQQWRHGEWFEAVKL